jgi:hypothetical protein
MRKLWQETRDPEYKTAVNWVSKAIRRMTRKKALERRETTLANTEVTSQAIWPFEKSLTKRDGQGHQLPFMVFKPKLSSGR